MTRSIDNLAPEVARLLPHKARCPAHWLTRAELGRLHDPILICPRCGAFQVVRVEPARTELLLALGSMDVVTHLDPEPAAVDPDAEPVLAAFGAPEASPSVGAVAPRRRVTVPMDCCRCGRVFEVRPGRAVVPLCPRCKQ